MSLISLSKVSKSYSNKDGVATIAIKNIGLHIKSGEMVAIMGPSGSGKSTLMHIIGLLDKPTSGNFTLQGTDIHKLNDRELAALRRDKIGFVFQSFNLVPRLSVAQNVELPMIYASTPASERRTKVKKLLKDVGLTARANHRPNQLSGGQMQRVAIARALINDPDIIMADEPTGNLDSKTGQQIMDLLVKLNKQGRTVIVVTHDLNIAKLAKRTIRLKDGKVEGKRQSRKKK